MIYCCLVYYFAPLNYLYPLSVVAVKAKNLIRLSVDGVFIDDVTGTEGVSSTDTNDPIYIGGVPGNENNSVYLHY